MFGMGMGELVVILIVALLVLGPDKIPDAAKAIGKGMRELRKQTRVVQETLEQDEQLGSTVRDLKSMLRGEEPRPIIKPPAQAGVGRTPITAQASPVEPSPAPDAPVAAAAAPAVATPVTAPAKPGSDSGNA
jgi:sec-independent protein translocase protein TatB